MSRMEDDRVAQALRFWRLVLLGALTCAALVQLSLWFAGAPVVEFR
jgi:hypothetical protein